MAARPRRPARRARPRRASGERPRHRLREPQVDRQRHQVLLGAVVDVAFQAASLVVLGLDEPVPRHLAAPRHAPSSSSRRPSSSARRRASRSTSPACAARPLNSRSSTVVSGIPGRSCSRSTPSVLVAVAHGRARRPTPVRVPGIGLRVTAVQSPRWASLGQVAARVSRSATVEPHLGPLGARPLGEQPRHPGRQLLGGVAAGRRLGEAAQHVVRRCRRCRARGGSPVGRDGRGPARTAGHGRGGQHRQQQAG